MDTTSTPKITIREARREDAALIAEVVCMAVGYDTTHPIYPVFHTLAACDHTQYSYRNTLVAEVDGMVAGALVGYDGADLEALREPIFPLLLKHLGEIPHIEDETSAGEFYLDSLGVLPRYRGLGMGSALLNAMSDRAYAAGHERVGLIVDIDNPKAEKLYTELGFVRVGRKRFLGHDMWHLQRENDIAERVRTSTTITPFQRRVYTALLDIPRGETITYSELARRIGCRSAQAVGQALKRNPFAPVVPCHRVIAANGSLGGYNGMCEGEEAEHKRKLLEEEGVSIPR